jgi:hypothetical protein
VIRNSKVIVLRAEILKRPAVATLERDNGSGIASDGTRGRVLPKVRGELSILTEKKLFAGLFS